MHWAPEGYPSGRKDDLNANLLDFLRICEVAGRFNFSCGSGGVGKYFKFLGILVPDPRFRKIMGGVPLR